MISKRAVINQNVSSAYLIQWTTKTEVMADGSDLKKPFSDLLEVITASHNMQCM
jgi:hypothetical protein